jgi:phosphatidylserine/phosphatidylglycerophosphate/cardiolipin synthase-like enzyme
VRVIMTNFSHEMTHKLDRWSAKKATLGGVDFKWYSATTYAHIKYTAIDDAFLAVGSSNGDSLTFWNNQELDLLLTNPATVAMFRSRVSDPDWTTGVPLTASDLNPPGTHKPVYALLELLDKYM